MSSAYSTMTVHTFDILHHIFDKIILDTIGEDGLQKRRQNAALHDTGYEFKAFQN